MSNLKKASISDLKADEHKSTPKHWSLPERIYLGLCMCISCFPSRVIWLGWWILNFLVLEGERWRASNLKSFTQVGGFNVETRGADEVLDLGKHIKTQCG